jgi:hypothetical protein
MEFPTVLFEFSIMKIINCRFHHCFPVWISHPVSHQTEIVDLNSDTTLINCSYLGPLRDSAFSTIQFWSVSGSWYPQSFLISFGPPWELRASFWSSFLVRVLFGITL